MSVLPYAPLQRRTKSSPRILNTNTSSKPRLYQVCGSPRLSWIPEHRTRIDIGTDGAYDECLRDNSLDGIIHTASPFTANITDPNELLTPAIKGTEHLLDSVARLAPRVKRIVITSSFAAMINPKEGSWPGHVYTEKGMFLPHVYHRLTNVSRRLEPSHDGGRYNRRRNHHLSCLQDVC